MFHHHGPQCTGILNCSYLSQSCQAIALLARRQLKVAMPQRYWTSKHQYTYDYMYTFLLPEPISQSSWWYIFWVWNLGIPSCKCYCWSLHIPLIVLSFSVCFSYCSPGQEKIEGCNASEIYQGYHYIVSVIPILMKLCVWKTKKYIYTLMYILFIFKYICIDICMSTLLHSSSILPRVVDVWGLFIIILKGVHLPNVILWSLHLSWFCLSLQPWLSWAGGQGCRAYAYAHKCLYICS